MEIVIGILVLLALFGGSKVRKAKCQVCGWRGSKKLWDSHKGCPNCRTDERPTEYSE
jgi:hypothetical protein